MSDVCLAFDTSNHWISLGLFGKEIAIERTERRGREASNILVPMIRDLLEEGGVQKPDWLICVRGPGSFTGARICVSTARNLAQAWDIPVLGIDSLAYYCYECVLSLAPEERGRVAVLLDGKQNKVYARTVDGERDPARFIESEMYDLNPADFFAGLDADVVCFTDDEAAIHKYIRLKMEKEPQGEEKWKIPPLHTMPEIRARTLYDLGMRLGGASVAESWRELVPVYLRMDPATANVPPGNIKIEK